MELRKSVVRIGNAAAAVAIVQGIVWIILCILEILISFEAWVPPTALSTHGQILNYALVWIVLYGEQTLSSSGLLIITFFYLWLSVFWVFISIFVIISNRRPQKTKTKLSYLLWGVLTVLICVYDIIIVGLLASDYSHCRRSAYYFCVAYGILFSLAARGYVLWIINLAFGILMIKNAMGMSKKVKPGYGLEPVSEFEDSRAPNRLRNEGATNAAYEWNTETSGFYKPPYSSMPPLGNSQNRPSSPTHSQSTDRFAQLGKPGGFRNPPQNIPPPKPPSSVASYPYPNLPRIPNPDYSPPNSPLKSALKGTRRSQKTIPKLSYLLWGVITVLISIYDIIVVGLLGSDYSRCGLSPYYFCVAYGILFSLAARGYVLWIINLAFGILMIKNAMGMSKKPKPGYGLKPVSAFDDDRAPNRLRNESATNPAYEWDNETSNSYKPLYSSMPPLGHSQNRPTSPTHSQPTDRVAKLGKPGGFRTPPQNIPPPRPPSNTADYAYPQLPRIPNPDYSPPNSPLKSALKGRAPQNPMMFGRDNRY
ncbi:hypothetical protein FQA39_LY06542 [Lamprigera yunnana]|nr:hypothetical protein FQA39_LY06542 [Lamprigera yunnana]